MELYTVFKSTGTHADVIAAAGAADLLRALEPRIVDCGDRFEIRLSRPATGADVAEADPGFQFLPRSPGSPAKVPDSWIHEVRSRPAGEPSLQAVGRSTAIDPEQRMYAILGRLNAAGGPNGIVQQFLAMPRAEWRRRVWDGLNGREDFVASPLLVQLFNPHAARGYSLLKPRGTDRNDKTKNQWSEPFREWLRYRGYFAGCAGWFVDKDIRLFTPAPGDIPWGLFREVMQAFRELRLGGCAAKIDCRAVIGLTRLLVEAMGVPVEPRSLIGSVFVANYRNMGQANTVMGMERLAVPAWFALRTAADKKRWWSILLEHDTILKRLSDNRSDEVELLRSYRGVLQSDVESAVDGFVQFLAAYGALVFRDRAGNPQCNLPLFSASNVKSILECHVTYREIMIDRGFRAIAAALRLSTVGALAARRHDVPDHREVRFGVLSEIRRSLALGKTELLRTVAHFVADFNAETAKRYQNQWHDACIPAEDIASFAALLDAAPSAELVGSMMCAFATCRVGDAAGVEIREPALEQAIPA